MAAGSLEELHSEARQGGHSELGAGALIVCDRLVRIYQAEGIEVQAGHRRLGPAPDRRHHPAGKLTWRGG